MTNHCGTCTACCRVFAIPAPLNKPAGKWCQHCTIGVGCQIYETRPKVCAEFECLWLTMRLRADEPNLPPLELRPDRCKVVFSATTKEDLISAMLMPGSPGAWRTGPARELIDALLKAGQRVIVGLPNTTTKIVVDQYGEREVQMTAPDENGMQWSVTEERSK